MARAGILRRKYRRHRGVDASNVALFRIATLESYRWTAAAAMVMVSFVISIRTELHLRYPCVHLFHGVHVGLACTDVAQLIGKRVIRSLTLYDSRHQGLDSVL